MSFRRLIVGLVLASSLLIARESRAVQIGCEGWSATASWWTSAYAVTTATLYDAGDGHLVEVSSSAALIVGGGTMTFSGTWASAPLDGNYHAFVQLTLYSGLDHVPTADELAAFPTSSISRLSGWSNLVSCTAPEPVCGNGIVEGTEACDDGNLVGGDGCSAICTTEPYGCTYTLGYWKTHNAYAKHRSLLVPWPLSEDTQLCGRTWLSILGTPPRGRAFEILAHQYIAARLNAANGASVATEYLSALSTAETIFADCTVTSAERADALTAASILDAYNNGAIGPGHCD